MYTTTVAAIVSTKKYFDKNPDAEIPTGIWTTPTFNKEEFYLWFRRCLHLKTGGRALTEKDRDMMHDYRIVQDYKLHRIRRSGRNILRTKLFKRLYPHIDNHTITDY